MPYLLTYHKHIFLII